MMRTSLTRPRLGAYREFQRFGIQRFERAGLVVSDRLATRSKDALRSAMGGAGLGRLGFAVGSGSDLKKTGRVHRSGNSGFSASGWIFVRSRSERTLGAIEAYTEGADIRPVKGRWLWIATDAIPSRVGRMRMTPERYNQSGLVSSIGPLVFLPGRHGGEARLVVRDVTVRGADGRRARRTPRRGGIRAGRERRDEITAFVGIRRTSRQARVDARQEIQAVVHTAPQEWTKALGSI